MRKPYFIQGRQEIKIYFVTFDIMTWQFALILAQMIFRYPSSTQQTFVDYLPGTIIGAGVPI